LSKKRFRALDLFCGLGGWSDGFKAANFDVLGVEIEPKIAKLYKHDVICADVKTLNPELFKGFDLIVGSPPCRDFTILQDTLWKKKKNPELGMILVNAFLNFVDVVKPKFWIMENAPGLRKFLDIKPKCFIRIHRGKRQFLWGDFPNCLIPIHYHDTLVEHQNGSLRKWKRAKIPFVISYTLGKACYDALINS